MTDHDEPDLANAPFRDDDERAEAEWLRARESDPTAAPPSPELADEHARLAALLAELPDGPADATWQAAVLRAVEGAPRPAGDGGGVMGERVVKVPGAPVASRRPRRVQPRWIGAGVGMAAMAAVAAIVLTQRGAGPGLRPDALAVELESGPAMRGSGDVALGAARIAPGARLIARGRPDGGGELRVYRDGATLVARCPSGPACAATGAVLRVEVTLDAPGKYDVILVSGGTAPLPTGSFGELTEAARRAGMRVVETRTFRVQ